MHASFCEVHAESVRVSVIHQTLIYRIYRIRDDHSYKCVSGVWAHRQRVCTTFLTRPKNSNLVLLTGFEHGSC